MSEIDSTENGRPGTRRRTSLSDKQRAILEFVQRSVASRGYPPSMREIGDAVGLASLSSVTHQLGQLELSGYLRRDPNRPRALEVLIDLPGSEEAETAIPVGDAAMVPLSDGSPPASRSRPTSRSTKCSRSPASSSARATCSCSRSSASR